MKEVEVKARVVNPEALHARLKERHIDLSVPQFQDDTIYVRTPGSLETFLANGTFLRLRTTDAGTLCTVKVNPNRSAAQDIVADEYETTVGSRESMEHIVAALGFSAAVQVRKQRQTGVYGSCQVCMDVVEGLGTFIELEKMVELESDVSGALKALLDIFDELGISPEDQVTKRYDVLILEQLA